MDNKRISELLINIKVYRDALDKLIKELEKELEIDNEYGNQIIEKDLYTRLFNVKEVAYLMGVNKESVRRWARTGKLTPIMYVSKKDGMAFNMYELEKFIGEYPKYRRTFMLSIRDIT